MRETVGYVLLGSLLLWTCIGRPVWLWGQYRRGIPSPPARSLALTSSILIVLLLVATDLSGICWLPNTFRPSTLSSQIVWIVLLPAVLVGLDLGVALITARHMSLRIRQEARIEEFSPRGDAASLLFLCVAGGIWEELLFRGFFFASAGEPCWGGVAALGAGTIAFAAQHLRQGPGAAVPALVYGLIFSAMYMLSGSLIAVMAAHISGNLAVLFGTPIILRRWAQKERRIAETLW